MRPVWRSRAAGNLGSTMMRWCLLLVLAAGCAQQPATVPAPTADAVRRDLARTVELIGRAELPQGQIASITSPGPAVVAEVHVRPGEIVERGDLLVRLDYPDGAATLEEARRELREAEAFHEQERQRFQDLLAPAMARAAAAAPEEKAEAEAALVAARHETDGLMEPAVRRLEEARRAVQLVDTAQVQALSSPMSGEVTALAVRPGQRLAPGDPVATVVDATRLRVRAPLPLDAVSTVEVGHQVDLRFVGLPGRKLEGEVEAVALAEGTPSGYAAVVALPNPERLVKPAMRAMATIRLETRTRALAVPLEAISGLEEGHPAVLARRGDRWVPVPVTLGFSDGRFVEVESGLREGERLRLPEPVPVTVAGEDR